jgi:hypothetical protein
MLGFNGQEIIDQVKKFHERMTVYKQASTCQDFKHLSEQVGNEMEIKSQP